MPLSQASIIITVYCLYGRERSARSSILSKCKSPSGSFYIIMAEMFEIACKLFENDVDELKKEWDVTCEPHIPQANIACR